MTAIDWTTVIHDLFTALPPTLTALAGVLVAWRSLRNGKRREAKLDTVLTHLGSRSEQSTTNLLDAAGDGPKT